LRFLKIIPVERPKILINNIPDPNWFAGFTTGEGNFNVIIYKSKDMKTGLRVQLRFRLYQHERDVELIKLLIKYLGSGKIEKDSRTSIICLLINKISDITNKIIPFFQKNQILGVKHLDYLDFCKIAKLMKEGSHLTLEGLDLIRKIKFGMNTGIK